MTSPRETHRTLVAHAEALAAAPLQLGPDAEVVSEPMNAKTVFSVRLPMEIAGAMLEEAERLDKRPSTLAGELVAEALAARRGETDVVLVNLGDLKRAVTAVAKTRAA